MLMTEVCVYQSEYADQCCGQRGVHRSRTVRLPRIWNTQGMNKRAFVYMPVTLMLIFHAAFALAVSPDWSAITRAWDEYCETPDAESAAVLLDALPRRDLQIEERPDASTTSRLYWGLACLAPRLIEGDERATLIGFRLFFFADAAYAEDLATLLGNVSSRHPALFLRLLQEERPKHLPSLDINVVVTMFDSDLTLNELRTERNNRLAAIASVEQPDLIETRDESLKLLEEYEL